MHNTNSLTIEQQQQINEKKTIIFIHYRGLAVNNLNSRVPLCAVTCVGQHRAANIEKIFEKYGLHKETKRYKCIEKHQLYLQSLKERKINILIIPINHKFKKFKKTKVKFDIIVNWEGYEPFSRFNQQLLKLSTKQTLILTPSRNICYNLNIEPHSVINKLYYQDETNIKIISHWKKNVPLDLIMLMIRFAHDNLLIIERKSDIIRKEKCSLIDNVNVKQLFNSKSKSISNQITILRQINEDNVMSSSANSDNLI